MPNASADPSRWQPGRLPVVLVRDARAPLDAAAATAELAGLRVVDAAAVPHDPWDLSATKVVVIDGIGHTGPENDLLDVVLRGAGAVVGVTVGARVTARMIDALQRMTTVIDWRTNPAMALEPEQLRLLHALATGTSARSAARAVHLSERTAHRRIADARDTLAAPSTNAAAAEVLATVRSWTG